MVLPQQWEISNIILNFSGFYYNFKEIILKKLKQAYIKGIVGKLRLKNIENIFTLVVYI